MRNLVRPALSTLFGGELKPLAPSHSTIYDVAGTVYDAGVGVGQSLSMMSWNLLAPCYKRPAEVSPDARILAQMAVVRASQADIVNLQEFWLEPSHLRTWRSVAAEEGYCMLVSPRSGGKRDGCCMLVRRTMLCAAPEVEALSYNDWGNRVVQLVTLRLALALALTLTLALALALALTLTPIPTLTLTLTLAMLRLARAGGRDPFTLTVAHTHLTFPHEGAHDLEMRWHQARKLATLVQARARLNPVVVLGDLNGDVEDEAVSLLLASGVLAPMSERTDWISHLAHNGKLMACDILAVADERPAPALTRVGFGDWSLGGTQEELLSGGWLSDHRPLSVSLALHDDVVE